MLETGCLCSSYTCSLARRTKKKGAVTSGTCIAMLGEQARREGRPFSGEVRVGQLHRGGGTRPRARSGAMKRRQLPVLSRCDLTLLLSFCTSPFGPRRPQSSGRSFSHRNVAPPQPLAPASVFGLSFPILFPICDPIAAHTSSVN